jgi:hypothetical protein
MIIKGWSKSRLVLGGSKSWLVLLLLYACSAKDPNGGRPSIPSYVPPPVGTAGGGASAPTTPPQIFGNTTVQPMAPAVAPKSPAACGSVDITASRILPSVMLVVDGSQSMMDNPYPASTVDAGAPQFPPPTVPAGMTRWDAIRRALVDPTNGVVPTLQGLVKFGLAVFGTNPTCPLPMPIIDPALNNAPAVTSGMPQMAPGLFTPTGPALDMIVDRLQDPTLVPPDGKSVGPQIVVLATDGDPNACDDPTTNYQPSIDAANKLKAKHLRMFVISVGQDAAKAHLQQMANIGAGLAPDATPSAMVYYPENPATLAMTLHDLIGKELSCDVELQGKGVLAGMECKGTVMLNGNPLDCNGANGWSLTDATHISLKGTACDTFKAAADAMLHANFPCESVIN